MGGTGAFIEEGGYFPSWRDIPFRNKLGVFLAGVFVVGALTYILEKATPDYDFSVTLGDGKEIHCTCEDRGFESDGIESCSARRGKSLVRADVDSEGRITGVPYTRDVKEEKGRYWIGVCFDEER